MVKHYLDNPIISTKKQLYLAIVIFLMPMLNFLGGINVDIYSPSMPAIAAYFNTTVTITKNTISITLFGWTIGALFFGVLIDSLGRKKILIYSLFIYVIACLLSPWCHNIHELMVTRFIQGFTVASITVGCRAIVMDNFTGHRYTIAILYTTMGYGLGPIIGPFIGGVLQHYIGWRANFIALAITGGFLLLILIVFVKENIPKKQSLHIKQVIIRLTSVLKHRKFIAGVIISGIMQIQIMLYPTVGPFIVENILHKNALVYGNSALIVGASYLAGAFISRFLLHHTSPKNVCHVGYIILSIGTTLAVIFAIFLTLTLATVMLPIIIICIATGLIFPNVMATNLKQFPESAGMSMAIQASLLLLIAALGIFAISHVHVAGLTQLAWVYLILTSLEIFIFFFVYKRIFV